PADVYRAYGLVQARLGKLAEGVSALTRAVELRPEESELRAARGWLYLVCDTPKLALPDFEEAVRLLQGQEPSRQEAPVGGGNVGVPPSGGLGREDRLKAGLQQ